LTESALLLLALNNQNHPTFMSQNVLPNGIDALLELGARMARGLDSHRGGIGLDENSTIEFRSILQRAREGSMAVTNARATRMLAIKRLAIADKALKTWLTKARLVVMLARGACWSESWIHTGFTERRTQVPRRLESRVTLGRALVSFFARHPEFGVNFAEVTAARGRAIYERVVQSCEMLQLAKDDCVLAKRERQTAENDLRHALRKIILSLKAHLAKSDPRWADFGLEPQMSGRRTDKRKRPDQKRAIPFVIRPDHPPHKIAAA
jgi:hypothetical protein